MYYQEFSNSLYRCACREIWTWIDDLLISSAMASRVYALHSNMDVYELHDVFKPHPRQRVPDRK